MRGLVRKVVTANIFLATLLVGHSLPAAAQTTGDPVARVIRISEGGRLDYSRQEDKWYQAYLEMKDYVNDRLRTDTKSYGSIEFYTGGQIGLNKDTTIEIVSESDANVINLKKGGLWGKLAKQKEKPVEVRTSSGVMGIRGTEFVITEKEEGTEVAVLEGQVIATPADGGEPIEVNPGMTVLLKLKAVPVVTQGEPDDLREQILQSQEWSDFNEALNWAHRINSYVPGVGFSRELYWAGRGIDIVQDPAGALKREAQNQLARRVPGGGMISGMFSSSSKKDPEVDFPTELTPDHQNEAGDPFPPSDFELSWKKLKNAKKYFIMVGRDEKMDDLVWTYETPENATSVRYPTDARPLEEGQYYWRVIGLDKKGEPVGRAAQTWFKVAAQ